MIRHIVIWNYNEDLTQEQKQEHSIKIKADLEGLSNVVSGVLKIDVIINPLPSSNADVMLDSLFESPEHLSNYQNNPIHKLAGQFIGGVMASRKCIDFIE